MLDSEWWLGSVYPKVCFQVALGGKCAAAYLTFEGSFSGVDAVVHFQGTLAAEHTVADDTLVGISHLLVNVLHQLLQL